MKIGIVDYGAGNLFSVCRAIEVLGYVPIVSDDSEVLSNSDKIILPGVGAFGTAMNSMKKNKTDIFLADYVKNGGSVLGICLGMQLFMSSSEEFGINEGLGFIDGSVERIKVGLPDWPSLNVGWRSVSFIESSGLNKRIGSLSGVLDNKLFYFTHSFQVNLKNQSELIGTISYGGHVATAVIGNPDKNILGVQFHPEKSGPDGLGFLDDWVRFTNS